MDLLPHEKPGLKSSLYQPLDGGAIGNIAEAAFDLLANSGMAVFSKTAREALAKAGADVDSDTSIVRMPRSMVEDAIASNPSSITLHGREERHDAVLEENRVHYGTGGTAIYVLDPDTHERRDATVQDVILNARMVDALKNIHVFTINVFPHDVKASDSIDINRFFHALDNTTKHVMGGIYTMDGCKKAVQLAETIAGGEQQLREKPFVSFITLIISPFKIDDHYGEMTCYLAEKGLPVVVPTEPICGTTAPITLAGNVLVHTAETLAGIALVQSVNKGAPGICGSVGSIPNLTTMNHLAGPVERAMINAAVSQMAQHFQIPLYSTGGTSDAKSVDIQAAYESAMSSLLVAMSGANYIHDIAGLMESDLTVSYEKLVMDNEILGMCQRVLRGIEVNDDTLAVDMLKRTGPGKDFLAEEHTLDYMRSEFYVPEIANRDKRDMMQDNDEAYQRAQACVADMRNKPVESRLPADVRSKVLEQFDDIQQA
jgi:trimethylamine--corrinoid protein Co-methyltransferase